MRMRSTAYEDSNAFARWGLLGPPAVTPANTAPSTVLAAPSSQAPPRSSNSPSSLAVLRDGVPADRLQIPSAAAGVPVGTAPGAGAGPVLSKSTPVSSRKNDTSRSDWLSYGERAPWSGGSRTSSVDANANANTNAKFRAKSKGDTVGETSIIPSVLPPPPFSRPSLPCLVPTNAHTASSHVGGTGGACTGAVGDADSLLARLAGKAKQAAAAALSASAAGVAGGSGTELPPPTSRESAFTTQLSRSGPVGAGRRVTPNTGWSGESGGPADGEVGEITAIRYKSGGGGGDRDESTAAAGGSAIGGAGAGAAGGARLAELCKEDKAKVARLMQDLVKLRAEKDGQKARFERLRAQNELIVKEMASLKEKFGQSMQLLRKYQNIVQEGEAAGGGVGCGNGRGRCGCTGDSDSQKVAEATGAEEIRALRDALRAAEESCQRAKQDTDIECTRREAMGEELSRVKGEAEDLRRQLDNQRNAAETETSATLAAEAANPRRPPAADDVPIPHAPPSDAPATCESRGASAGGPITPAVGPSAATAARGGDGLADRGGATSNVPGPDFVGQVASGSRPERLGGDESTTIPGVSKSAEKSGGGETGLASGGIDERVSAGSSEDERQGTTSTAALAALQEQVEELKQEVAMVGVRQLAITGLPPMGKPFFVERARVSPFGGPDVAPSAASVISDDDLGSGESGVSEAPARVAGGGGGGVKTAGEPGTTHRVNTAPSSRHSASSTVNTTTAPSSSIVSCRYNDDAGTSGAQVSDGSNARRYSNGEGWEPAGQRVARVVREGHAREGGRRREVAGRTRGEQRVMKTNDGPVRLDSARAVEGGSRRGLEAEEEGDSEGDYSDGEDVGWWAKSADKLLLVEGDDRNSGCDTHEEEDTRVNSSRGGGTVVFGSSEEAIAGEKDSDNNHPVARGGKRGNDKRDWSVPETGTRRGVDKLAARRPRTWFESAASRDHHPSNGNPERRVRVSGDGGEGGHRSPSPRAEGQHGPNVTEKKTLLRTAAITATTTTTVPRNAKLRVSWSSISARSTEDSDDTANDFPIANGVSVSRTGQARRWPPPPPPPPRPPAPTPTIASGVISHLCSSTAPYSIQGGQRRGRGVVETRAVNQASGARRRRLGSGGYTPPLATSSAVPRPSGRRAVQARVRDAAAVGRLGREVRPAPGVAPVLAATDGVTSRACNADALLASRNGGRLRRVKADEEDTSERLSRNSGVAARAGNWEASVARRNGGSDAGGGRLGVSASGVKARQASGSWEEAKGAKCVNRGGGGWEGCAREALEEDDEPVLLSGRADEAMSTMEGGADFFDGSLLDLIDDLEEGQIGAGEVHSFAETWRESTNREQHRTSAGQQSVNHGGRNGVYSGGGGRWERRDDREGSRDEKREAAVSFFNVGDY